MKTGDGSFSIGSEVWPGLGKIIEETSELGVELGKLIAMNGQRHYEWEDRDLADNAFKECADVVAAVEFFLQKNGGSFHDFILRVTEKKRLYEKWHNKGEG